jgi:hypothetical protein
MRKIVLMIALCLSSESVFATYTCSGPITYLQVGGDGSLYASFGGLSYVRFCHLGITDTNGVTAAACSGMYALFVTARAAGWTVYQVFDDGLTCATQAEWATLSSSAMNGGPQTY